MADRALPTPEFLTDWRIIETDCTTGATVERDATGDEREQATLDYWQAIGAAVEIERDEAERTAGRDAVLGKLAELTGLGVDEIREAVANA